MTVWTGVFPAVTTKLREDQSVDLAATQASLDRLINNGVSGVIVLPMLGENASLTAAEREAVIRAAKEAVAGRVPLLSGLAHVATTEAVASARHYEKLGAEGLMAFPSIAYKSDPRETAAWYKALGRGCGLPIMIYNNPIAYGVDVTPAILNELADTPSIVCVKEETGDIRRVTDIYNECGDRFSVFCGVDDLLLESMALGVTGWVSGMTNAWTAECVQLFNLCKAGKYDEARALYRILTPAFHLDTDVKLVQYIKLAEQVVYGAPEWVREPRLPLIGTERARVLSVIEATVTALQAKSAQRSAA
ncbi:dihydrodipicolinate synthase family protein [Starkeya sp. ORNL1]|uniref:dihydrodipicolinate synthase family protein n=1 Tax=Starkeya sp. ORNL1 TaxID=2709380 RepID=UPI0014633D14|nr:dihydrodipicolinate synthase family protein [Starkeya sp. ORNL1]QJP16294.1 dihydrodipicolinate synthase family protein [Starkeya sp. ORNL1]